MGCKRCKELDNKDRSFIEGVDSIVETVMKYVHSEEDLVKIRRYIDNEYNNDKLTVEKLVSKLVPLCRNYQVLYLTALFDNEEFDDNNITNAILTVEFDVAEGLDSELLKKFKEESEAILGINLDLYSYPSRLYDEVHKKRRSYCIYTLPY